LHYFTDYIPSMKQKAITLFLYLFALLAFTSCTDEKPVDIIITFSNSSFTSDLTSITLSTTVTINRGRVTEKGFLMDQNAGLSFAASQKLENLSRFLTFSLPVLDLAPNKTYFVRPYAIAENKVFLGDEFQVNTTNPTYSHVTPIEAGRGQRIQITGNFLTSKLSDLSILVGGLSPTVLSFTSTSLEFLIPETAEIGSHAALTLKIKEYDLSVSETIAISRWSILKNTPFNTAIGGDYMYSYTFAGKLYYGSGHTYDPTIDSWASTPEIVNGAPGLISYPVDFQIGTKGYVGFWSSSKLFYEFDLQQKVWTYLNAFPGTGHDILVGVWAANGNKGYYGLGYNLVNDVTTGLKEFWEFNPSTNGWTRLPDYPGTAIYDGVSFCFNEYVFVGGGYNRVGTEDTFIPEFFAYNTLQNTWTQVASFPVTPPRIRLSKAVVIGSKAYFFIVSNIWIYDFESNTWSLSEDKLPTPANRSGYDVLVLGNAIYLASGTGEIDGVFNYIKDFCKYYPQD